MSRDTPTGAGGRPPPIELLPNELRKRIPPLYATEKSSDPMVHAKLFTPWTGWTWFITEFDGHETCFGLVSGHEIELGYFNLAELEAIEGPGGLRIERDLHFDPQPLSRVRQELETTREGPERFGAHEEGSELNVKGSWAAAVGGAGRAPPSPLEFPAIRLVETRLETTGAAGALGKIATPSAGASILHGLIGEADCEHFAVLFLNGRHNVTHAQIVSRGTAQSTMVHPREVFKAAMRANAAAIIVGHNHPSGDVLPSTEDAAVNERLKEAGKLLGIPVLDSLIIGPTGQFYAASTGEIQAQPTSDPVASPDRTAVDNLATICHGLLRDIDEVLERQGQEWWDETVTSGTRNRALAEKHLGLEPYRPAAEPDEHKATGKSR